MIETIRRFLASLFSRPAAEGPDIPVTPERPDPVPDLVPPGPTEAPTEAPAAPEPRWITLTTFQQASGLTPAQAARWYPHVRAACLQHHVTSPIRIAAWIAQIGHESGGFVYTREIWGPTSAQQRYEGRADLGNTQPGDGSRYRGRGLIQITGRANYMRVAAALGIDAVTRPELVEADDVAALSAAWWWSANGCNELAETGTFEALTRRINGGLNGIEDRRRRHMAAQAALREATWT